MGAGGDPLPPGDPLSRPRLSGQGRDSIGANATAAGAAADASATAAGSQRKPQVLAYRARLRIGSIVLHFRAKGLRPGTFLFLATPGNWKRRSGDAFSSTITTNPGDGPIGEPGTGVRHNVEATANGPNGQADGTAGVRGSLVNATLAEGTSTGRIHQQQQKQQQQSSVVAYNGRHCPGDGRGGDAEENALGRWLTDESAPLSQALGTPWTEEYVTGGTVRSVDQATELTAALTPDEEVGIAVAEASTILTTAMTPMRLSETGTGPRAGPAITTEAHTSLSGRHQPPCEFDTKINPCGKRVECESDWLSSVHKAAPTWPTLPHGDHVNGRRQPTSTRRTRSVTLWLMPAGQAPIPSLCCGVCGSSWETDAFRRGFRVYHLVVANNASLVWYLRKRFSEFLALHAALVREGTGEGYGGGGGDGVCEDGSVPVDK